GSVDSLPTRRSSDLKELRDAVRPEGVLRSARLMTLSAANGFRSTDLTDMIQIESELHEVLQIPEAPENMLTNLFYRMSEAATLRSEEHTTELQSREN